MRAIVAAQTATMTSAHAHTIGERGAARFLLAKRFCPRGTLAQGPRRGAAQARDPQIYSTHNFVDNRPRVKPNRVLRRMPSRTRSTVNRVSRAAAKPLPTRLFAIVCYRLRFARSICIPPGKDDKYRPYHNGEVEPNAPIVNVP
jgi:hypothetical protein